MGETGGAASPVAVTWAVAPGMTLEEALARFLEDVQARGLARKTLAYYRWQLTKFCEWLAGRGVAELAGLEARGIRAYIVALRERGLAGTSQHAAARAIRAWCTFLVRDELLPVSPMRHVGMPKKAKKILPALAVADVRRLLAVELVPRDRALLLFLLDTGARAAECLALNVGDVDLATGEVFIAHGKGDKSRRAYMGETTRAAVAAYLAARGPLAEDAPLWVSLTCGGRLTLSGLTLLLHRVEDRAGVHHIGPHAFRRTCAVNMYRNRAQVTDIAGLLGHADLVALQQYLDLQAADYSEAHRRFGVVDHFAWEDPPGG